MKIKFDESVPFNKVVTGYEDEVAEALSNPSQPSVFEDYDDFQLFILRALEVGREELSYFSVGFAFREGNVYVYQREKQNFVRFADSFIGFAEYLDRIYERNQKLIAGYSEEVERLESFLFERRIPTYFMDFWFDIKKDLSRLESFYYRNQSVYREFFKKCSDRMGFPVDELQDIEEMIGFQAVGVAALKNRLDGVHHYFSSIKSERLNRTLFILTMISGVFLPLNLIVGFFGMNTESLFFTGDPEGTNKVLILLASVFAVILLGARVLKAVDRYILRFLLGRYRFYNNISKKLSHIDESFRI